MLNYNNNILSSPHPVSVPCISNPTGCLLDRKAVGTPSTGGVYQRRHSVTLATTKLNQNQFLNFAKEDPSLLSSGTVTTGSSNKENRLRDRSFSETGDRLLQKCLGPGGPNSQVNSSRYKTELCRPFEENGVCKYGDKCQFAPWHS